MNIHPINLGVMCGQHIEFPPVLLVRGGIREFVNDTDGLTFLEREVMGLDVDGNREVRVHDRAIGLVSIYALQIQPYPLLHHLQQTPSSPLCP